MWGSARARSEGNVELSTELKELDERVLLAGSAGAFASRLLPNMSEKTFPPIIGERETKPQFSEKCAVAKVRGNT